MLRLPDDLRGAFKDPLGPIYTDANALVADAGTPLIAVGDVVTYHLRRSGREPEVAVIDGRTEREAVEGDVREVLDGGTSTRTSVVNGPATLSADLLRALREAIETDGPVTVVVEGEEDLATLPAVLAAPDGASVVYGQPGEGMVHVAVTDEARTTVRELFERLEGDVEGALELVEGG